MAIGEAGQIITGSNTENEPITVNFTQSLDDPIIVLTGTTVGGDPHSLRIIDVQADSFTFIMAQFTNRMHGSAIAVARQARGEAFSS